MEPENDHQLAARLATEAGQLLVQLREAVGLRALDAVADSVKKAKSSDVGKPSLQPVVFRDANAFAYKLLDAKKTVLAEHGSPLMMNRDLAAYELIGRCVARQTDRKGGPIDLIRRDINFSTMCVNYFTRNV